MLPLGDYGSRRGFAAAFTDGRMPDGGRSSDGVNAGGRIRRWRRGTRGTPLRHHALNLPQPKITQRGEELCWPPAVTGNWPRAPHPENADPHPENVAQAIPSERRIKRAYSPCPPSPSQAWCRRGVPREPSATRARRSPLGPWSHRRGETRAHTTEPLYARAHTERHQATRRSRTLPALPAPAARGREARSTRSSGATPRRWPFGGVR